MANPVVNSAALVWLGGYDLSRGLHTVRLAGSRAQLPDNRFGDEVAATFPGIQQVDATADGFYSAGSGEPDTVAASRIITKEASEWPLTVLPQDAPGAAGADGNIAYNVRTAQFGMRFGGEHGQSLPFYLSSRARTGRLDRATVVLPKATYAATATGVERQLGALTSADKMVAVLHVFAVTGGTWTLTVESDTVGFGSPVVRATFTGATGITRQVVEIAGPVTDDYWRVVLTKSGGTSCVAAALLAVTPA